MICDDIRKKEMQYLVNHCREKAIVQARFILLHDDKSTALHYTHTLTHTHIASFVFNFICGDLLTLQQLV